MTLKDLSAHPTLLPVPKLYKHVIRWWQYIWKSWMNSHTPNIICMCLKNFDLVHCIVIVYPNKHVISTSNNPLFTCYKLSWPNCKTDRRTLEQLLPLGNTDHQFNIFPDKKTVCTTRAPGSSVTSNDFAIVCTNRVKILSHTNGLRNQTDDGFMKSTS